MTADDSIDDKVRAGAKTEILPAVKICNAKKYISYLTSEGICINRRVCTDNCSGYNPECEYWKREFSE